ncbi:histidine kinase dimerization/phospho-acceptor domain-containing protein [Streptomyces hirsutus]|uniref:histidine kinase dimerization/phospho-acceptor domain-containing protein n=1 Tax=Streptomyces hirsutus TaxID=35620 RepID=UPI0036659483
MRLRLPWSFSSVRLRLLIGLAMLLVAGLAASAVISAFLLESFLDKRNQRTLLATAERLEQVIGQGPQTADADQLGAFLGSPLGTVAVDEDNKVLLSTGSAAPAADALATVSTTVPVGSVATSEGDDLSAVRIPSPGLTIDRGPDADTVKPAAVILAIDTSVDNATTNELIGRQLALIGSALLVLLGLSVVVLRLGLRPLARMARSADAIAAGSLSERLPTQHNGSEADLLAKAVNRAFDAQARAEATVRSLAADTSHELRTPLSTISGWLDLHRQGGLPGPGLETALEHIESEVGRMRLLVVDLALPARLDAGRPVEQDDVDLTVLAAGVVEDAQIIYPQRGISLAPAPPAPVVGDAPRLQQVLRDVTWRLETIPAADFMGMPTGASDAGCIESFAENPVHWVKVRPPEVGRHWEEHGTWLRPPILIDRRLLDLSDSGLQVLEGRTRVGVLRGRLREGLHVASHHQAWVGHP